MKDYLLFIDTETSGLPKRWDLPYTNNLNWPYALQISWIIYHPDGTEIKRENYFINENDVTISKDSIKIHGITEDFLKSHGKKRKDILRKLAYDIKKFDPLIIGHFVELDIHVLSVDYLRARIKNPFKGRNFFCTMLKSHDFSKNPRIKFLKLSELFEYLFDKHPADLHNAEKDAEHAADCFFELLKRGQITIQDVTKQKEYFLKQLNALEEQVC
ncbi:Exonuclease RNase T and DNA polymerase III [Pseudopedobacter saltans DSM 12145]|uniref:Exonuclease RNase T and DNA polymerase III n=1 Tax=Pseudopedobacter saltans (strain ATCC 51119 / DSM 12145 / JCM 21818 / CCUG 39354 / LMG 10337 / NBRC 100064 / NCIMB 13643) TaxID=762903 RepID=F0SBJ6_PSESL|nr:3'-5' exonuclease [Pseudopedobacter saltans]ADY51642.1 Exonuclease RNase T and DNA polymerase III [Pseudopedobacter saltans DSM 12145]